MSRAIGWINIMKKWNLNEWLCCDDEMKMDSFLARFEDEKALRRFAVLNAKSVEALLTDSRSRSAVVVAEAYLDNRVTAQELEVAFYESVSAFEEIESTYVSEEDPTRYEEDRENAALVALWAALPVGHTGISSLESAQESALHTAFYCFQIHGSQALEEQLERFKAARLV